ncbi:MAG: sugar phosphate isomerase/epimerase family protein [Candidatus Brocadiia bacterium]|nr:sugar phosphate isomerase/epimerase family protein [Candidatus Brocadiia bacterium]
MDNLIGTVSGCLEAPSPEETFEVALDYGFGRIEWFESEAPTFSDEPVAGLIAELARRHGMTNSYHAPWVGRWNMGQQTPGGAQETVTEMLRSARRLDAHMMTVHLGIHAEGADHGEAVRTAARAFQACTPLAEEFGVCIAVENSPGPSVHQKLGVDLADFDALFEICTSPRIGLTLDTGHANTSGTNMALLEKHGARLLNTHIHDNDGSGDAHQPPGAGTVDWDAVLGKVKGLAYAGPFILEYQKVHGRFRDFMATLREL